MTFPQLMDPLLHRRDLSQVEAEALMELMMSGEASDAQIGGALTALRIKGVTPLELAAFATVMRAKAARLNHAYDDLVDTCGTGGGCPSFNLSTAAAIVAAAAGARIAKHGNRGVTSACGSADVLEALGVKVGQEPDRLSRMLDSIGIVFMFAPAHHSAMKNVGAARKELGFRTVFNQLGPLANPAGATRQVIGVYDRALVQPMAEALLLLGAQRALVVHGAEGLDEISPCGDTYIYKVWGGTAEGGMVHPSTFGSDAIDPADLRPGATPAENADILKEAISDPASPRSKAVLPSAAAAIWLAGLDDDPVSAYRRAYATIASGAAEGKLAQLIEESNRA